MDYDYPLDYTWNTDEIITVITFYNAVEEAYEIGIESSKFIELYKEFKKVVDSKSEEKQLDSAFEELSGYSIYQVVKASSNGDLIKLEVRNG